MDYYIRLNTGSYGKDVYNGIQITLIVYSKHKHEALHYYIKQFSNNVNILCMFMIIEYNDCKHKQDNQSKLL